MPVDLHTHSIFSDGTLTPSELVDLAQKTGLSSLALTDHDTVEGVSEALQRGKQCGVEVIPGLEIGCIYMHRSYHILGFWIDPEHQGLDQWLKKLQQGRQDRNHTIIDRLTGLGIDISYEEVARVSQCGQTGRPHIARLLVSKGVVANLQEAFTRYLRQGRPAYVSRFCYSVEESVAMIHEAGGIAVLAHPVQVGVSQTKFIRILQDFVAFGLDGLEVYYPSHTRKMRRRLRQAAANYHLGMSGGSDFHGDNRPGIGLSGEDSDYCVSNDILTDLHKCYTHKQGDHAYYSHR